MLPTQSTGIFLFLLCLGVGVVGNYFYIYDWSKEFGDVYPTPGSRLDPDTSYDDSFGLNDGIGAYTNGSTVGLFSTWQFSLYRNIMARLLVSKYRTFDASKASAFIIPFDAGVHSFIDHVDGRRRLASPHGWAVIRWLQESVKDKQVLWKNAGHDHFVVYSLTQFTMTGIGVKELLAGVCQNCSMLTIEGTPNRISTMYHRSKKYWFTVPYPSSFHYHEDIVTLPWSKEQQQKRSIFVLFMGSIRTLNIASNAFRKALHYQCLNSTGFCQWYEAAHSCKGVVNMTSNMLLLRESVFCPQPIGDTVTRKGVFDALIAGCIPVIFAKATLRLYVPWFLSQEDMDDISVYIDLQAILRREVNFLDVLKALTEEDIHRKQAAIERVAPRLQYSIVPRAIREQVNSSRSSGGAHHAPRFEKQQTYDPPFEDAVSIIIQRITNPRTIEPITGFTTDELKHQVCLTDKLISSHPDYANTFKAGSKHLAYGKRVLQI